MFGHFTAKSRIFLVRALAERLVYGAVQPAEFCPIGIAAEVAFLVGSVTEVAMRVTVPPEGMADGEV